MPKSKKQPFHMGLSRRERGVLWILKHHGQEAPLAVLTAGALIALAARGLVLVGRRARLTETGQELVRMMGDTLLTMDGGKS